MEEPVLVMKDIVKSFPGVVANRGITLEVKKGEIHALLGENGAGKTVLMSILYGLYYPDSGQIILNGSELHIRSPKDAIRNRIGMVHQHFMLVPTLSVAENLIMGQYPAYQVIYSLDKINQEIKDLGAKFGLDVDPTALVASLSVGEQQRVEILKALYHGADLLILDEPTAVLTPQETNHLLKFLKELASHGKTIIFITHKLNEVMDASDRVTVLRDGKVVGTTITAETNPRELARMMVGREVLMDLNRENTKPGEAVLSVRNLKVKDERGLLALKGVSFDVHRGEIVGIAGVSGNGQTELALALSGLVDDVEFDQIVLCGKSMTPKTLRNHGHKSFAHIPEDRHKMGVILPFSVAENFILERYKENPFSSWGLLNNGWIKSYSKSLVSKFSIRVANVEDEIANLSGGNQQKVVVARELDRNPCFLLANQPTRGIDIGATEFVHKQLLQQRDANTGILLISTELEEIFALSDRIIVIYEGEFMGEVKSDPSLLEQVGLMMAGKRLDSVFDQEEA